MLDMKYLVWNNVLNNIILKQFITQTFCQLSIYQQTKKLEKSWLVTFSKTCETLITMLKKFN